MSDGRPGEPLRLDRLAVLSPVRQRRVLRRRPAKACSSPALWLGVDDHRKTQNSGRTRKAGVIVAALCCGGAGDAAARSRESGATEAQSSPRAPDSRPVARPPAGTPAALDLASAPRRVGRDFRAFTCRATGWCTLVRKALLGGSPPVCQPGGSSGNGRATQGGDRASCGMEMGQDRAPSPDGLMQAPEIFWGTDREKPLRSRSKNDRCHRQAVDRTAPLAAARPSPAPSDGCCRAGSLPSR
jgi:hypothetical protein